MLDKNKWFQAVLDNDVATIKEYLASGFDVNAVNERKRTAAILATMQANYPLVQLLIDHGADVNQQDDIYNSVFLLGAVANHFEVIKMCKGLGDPSVLNRYGGSPLIPASEKGHLEIVRWLLENTNINVNHFNNIHWTALHEVGYLGKDNYTYHEITKLLLQHGADKHLLDRQGRTALQLANYRGFKGIAKIIEAW